MHDQQPGTSAFTAVGAPQLNTVTNLPEVRPPTGTPSHGCSIILSESVHARRQPLQAWLQVGCVIMSSISHSGTAMADRAIWAARTLPGAAAGTAAGAATGQPARRSEPATTVPAAIATAADGESLTMSWNRVCRCFWAAYCIHRDQHEPQACWQDSHTSLPSRRCSSRPCSSSLQPNQTARAAPHMRPGVCLLTPALVSAPHHQLTSQTNQQIPPEVGRARPQQSIVAVAEWRSDGRTTRSRLLSVAERFAGTRQLNSGGGTASTNGACCATRFVGRCQIFGLGCRLGCRCLSRACSARPGHVTSGVRLSVIEFVGVFWQGVRSPCSGSARDSEVLLHGSRRGSHPWAWLPLPLAVSVVLLRYWLCHEAVSWCLAALHRLFSPGAHVGQRQGARLGALPLWHVRLVSRDTMQQAC